ncbi:hypothetical protein J8G26_08785 [Acidovorax sp. JG5]|uniref:hypothetical protein n=1 Tax=Acidovorax sp. JG5 TaxID=2822718 RepID=UPI001B329F99|nr:hypothetical protein [Acidovorax sp. JG5]MBP3980821.1 hypothetical protein [Acidovorax sp. JG5]
MSTQPTDEEIDAVTLEVLGYAALDKNTNETARLIARAVLAKWGTPAPVGEEPVAWAATSEDGVVEALGMNQSRRFDTPLYLAPQSVVREPQWSPASTPPKESDGEVLVRMADGRCEIAWATYWHGSSNAFAQWTFRDPDEEETPVEWMLIPHGIKGGQHVTE